MDKEIIKFDHYYLDEEFESKTGSLSFVDNNDYDKMIEVLPTQKENVFSVLWIDEGEIYKCEIWKIVDGVFKKDE